MENNKVIEDLLKEMKEKISGLQSNLSHLENILNEMTKESEKNSSLESSELKQVSDVSEEANASLKMPNPEEDFSFELPKLEPAAEETSESKEVNTPVKGPVKEESEESYKIPNLVKPDGEPVSPVNEGPIEETSIQEKPNRVVNFKRSPSNLATVKGFFTPEELRSIISGLENVAEENRNLHELEETPIVETPSLKPSSIEEEKNSSMVGETSSTLTTGEILPVKPSDTVVEGAAQNDNNEVAEEVQTHESTLLEQPVAEKKPEEIATNLAGNVNADKMKTIDEIFKNFELEENRKGK